MSWLGFSILKKKLSLKVNAKGAQNNNPKSVDVKNQSCHIQNKQKEAVLHAKSVSPSCQGTLTKDTPDAKANIEMRGGLTNI